MIADGANFLSDFTNELAFEYPNCTLAPITVPTHVPWGPFRRLVAEGTGSPVTKLSPPITRPAKAGTTGVFAVPLSMMATVMPWPR